MDFVRSGRALTWIFAALAFAVTWAGAASCWGSVGLWTGWIPAAAAALLAAGLAWLMWNLVGLFVLLGWHCHARAHGEALS